MNNLTQVQQGVQTRTFAYDALSRLTSAQNPESGTVSYGYDANGNLVSKYDARAITATIAYDPLNRPVSKTYSNDPQNTAPVYYYYDNQTLPSGAPSFSRGYSTGRLVAATYGASDSNGTYRSYDALGRVTQQFQQTDGTNYQVDAAYNLASAMTSQTYPGTGGNRRTVSFGFDAAGRLSSLTSNATSYSSSASVSNVSYAAHGALSSQTLGNGLLHQMGYNSRLQPTSITLASHLSLTYSYGATATVNNGNITSVGYSGGGLSYSQSFTYDSLNRLATAQENGGASWTQTNGYDRYGNRTVTAGVGQSLSFNTNNRVIGLSYDSAGNVTNDNLHSYAFDAENKIVKLDNVLAYIYDGEGKRVRKLVGENTRFVYGITGELLAEYNAATGAIQKEYVYGASGLTATIEPTTGTQYLTADHLSSPRIVTNQSGAIVARRDFLPFGEEVAANVGGRSSVQGYGGDNTRQKFATYERDSESNLDFAQARYYSSAHGRFTTPDPLLSSGRPNSPQSWNRFSYVLNNPLIHIDPLGLYECKAGKTKCDKFEESARKALDALNKYDSTSKEYKAIQRGLKAFFDFKKDGTAVSRSGKKDGLIIVQGKDSEIRGLAKTVFDQTVTIDRKTQKEISRKPDLNSLEIQLRSDAWGSDQLPGYIANEGSNVQDVKDLAAGNAQSLYQMEFTSLYAHSLVMEKVKPDKPLDFTAGRTYDPSWAKTDLDANREKGIRQILESPRDKGGYGLSPPKVKKQ